MRPDLDERTLEVAQHEVSRLSGQIKELEPETVPFLERYQTMLGHLEEFRTRLSALLKTFRKADVDARAVRLGEVLKSVRLFFLPKKKWQETTLDEARCELVFNHTFVENAGTCCRAAWRREWPAVAGRSAAGRGCGPTTRGS
jgi:hypothetical protein